ncbi:MAG: DEAD/DEAH box helicase [Acidobacteriaceae bacterium]
MEAPSSTEAPPPAALAWAHPLVRDWFVGKFGTPTEPQEQGWPHIVAGKTVLISAPTGSGKTLTAFLACIDQLVRQAIDGTLRDQIEVVYISPLKALGNDIQKNLEAPLAEIAQRAGERGYLMPAIRTFVRSGDTPPKDRQRMLKRPPHILVTTPESLYILLTSEKSRALLKCVRTVIVDEIHAVADDKRGSHLALSLERLDALVTAENDPLFCGIQRAPVRIGLSATQKPIELVAEFLTGSHPERSPAVIVNVGHRREMDLAVEIPESELGAVATHQQWDEISERLCALINSHRSTLIFVNTRAMAERLAHALNERLTPEGDPPNVLSHHGSLSRKIRLNAENKLKQGEIKALVATASLELGIDIGFIDLVCQIGTCRAIGVLLQRIGRAGHWRGAVPKGRLFATTRDELIECAALMRAIQAGELDRLEVPMAALDILAQQIVAMCAAEEWHEDALLALIRRAYPYRELSARDYEDVLAMLAEGITAKRGRYGAYLQRDRVHRILRARRGSRLVAVTNGGAIPDNALFTVIAEPEGVMVATLDEDFATDCSVGDVILLGNTSWRIRRIESKGRVLVEDAHGVAPTVPFWRGEAPQRTQELSQQVGEIRQQVSDFTPDLAPGFILEQRRHPQARATVEWLMRECAVSESAAEQITDYIVTGRAVLGGVPTQNAIFAERFFDEGGGMQLIIHAPFGGRMLKAWGLSLRKKFCKSFNFELQAAATDNGLNIALAEQHSFVLSDVFHYVVDENARHTLEQASLDSPIFASRWRWNAGRALALLRYRGGKKVAPQIQRIISDDLLASIFPDLAACQENVVFPRNIPDHPLVREVMRDVLHEGMDLDGLRSLLRDIASGEVKCFAVDTPVPSVFAHEILNSNPYAFLDDAPLEERRARAVQLRQTLPESVLREVGGLDGAAIELVREEAWPDVRDAHDLHDALLTLIAIPEAWTGEHPESQKSCAAWAGYFDELIATGRASRACVQGKIFWTIAERAATFSAAYPGAHFEQQLPQLEAAPTRDDAVLALINGWLQHAPVITAEELAQRLSLTNFAVEHALLRIQASGTVLQGSYSPGRERDSVVEWCERRLLARIHRLTVSSLRKQIEPVTAAIFMRWLFHWQHLAPGSHLSGAGGLLELVRQMQGFEAPASAWERQLFAPRMHGGYDPRFLDQLCLSGAIGWGRLSPHPAALNEADGNTQQRRVVPTSVAPLTFFIRDDAEWMRAHHFTVKERVQSLENCLSDAARRAFERLRQRGAQFFADLVRATCLPKAEIESALWELIAAGLVTADGFDNLRTLIDPKRKLSIAVPRAIARVARPSEAATAGRWSLLWQEEDGEPALGDRDRAVASTCRMLLKRYGVVFRELLARESNLPKWRELLICFRRMEDRGELRGGRFVSGFLGEQFALPQALESLRAMRSKAVQVAGEEITISAADPLNLVGIIVPGERVPAISGRAVTFRNGVAIERAIAAAGD